MDAVVLMITFLLNLTGTDDPLTDGFRGLARLSAAEFIEAQRRDFDLYVYTV